MIVWGGNKKNRLAQPSNQFRNERNESVIIKQNWKRNWLKKREQKKKIVEVSRLGPTPHRIQMNAPVSR